MKKTTSFFSILAICGAVVLLGGTVAAAALFEHGVYSPASCFSAELGLYTGGYFTISSALIFNLALGVFGLAFAVFMAWYGCTGSALHTAAGFFGALTGVLAAAQALFTLNFAQFHSIVTIALHLSVFVTCILYMAAQLRSSQPGEGTVLLVLAFGAGIASVAFAGFVLSGGMAQVFAEDLSGAARSLVVPFAVVDWASLMLTWAFGLALAFTRLLSRSFVLPAAPVRDVVL